MPLEPLIALKIPDLGDLSISSGSTSTGSGGGTATGAGGLLGFGATPAATMKQLVRANQIKLNQTYVTLTFQPKLR